jgi:transcriptional regulator with XRE-family HTH domain
MTFAEKVRSLRQEQRLTVSELSAASGITRQALDLLEKDKRKPTLATAESIAVALGKKLRVFEGLA